MPEKLTVNPSTRVDEVGRTGIYPASGPLPPGRALVRGQGELGHPEQHRAPTSDSRQTSAAALIVGRALLGGYFLYNGINHFLNRSTMAAYARSQGVPAPNAAVVGSGAMIAVGGLSLLTGTRPKIGASLITAFLLGVSPKMHAFWKVQDEQQRMQELVNFTKNMALIGGAALAAAVPEPWPMSLGRRGGALAPA